jgi:N-acetyl-gamma-glutamyl-phosphate reductase
MFMQEFNVAILGASGYTGGELIRILVNHPNVKISYITAEKHAGKKVSEVFPHLKGILDLKLEKLDPKKVPDDIDIVFAALPHGTSAEVIHEIYKRNVKIIDLGADFRLNEGNYRQWYGDHPCSDILEDAVYGISELNKEQIAETKLIANPGCYPTSSILPLAPLLKENIVDENSIIIDSKSGVSGAGRSPSLDLHYCEVSEGFKAYKVAEHRHTPEIEQHLSEYSKKDVNIIFTPHLIPIDRGIFSTIYVKTDKEYTTSELLQKLKDFYKNSHFIRIYDEGQFPNISYIRGSNFCDIGIKSIPEKKSAVIVSVIDNLVKGAAGQAVQNMNIMMDLPETTGLNINPVYP